jgi:hypothetical protein
LAPSLVSISFSIWLSAIFPWKLIFFLYCTFSASPWTTNHCTGILRLPGYSHKKLRFWPQNKVNDL